MKMETEKINEGITVAKIQETALNQYALYWEQHLTNLGITDQAFMQQIISTALVGFKDGWRELEVTLQLMSEQEKQNAKPSLII